MCRGGGQTGSRPTSYRDHASVRLPVVGHSNFRCVMKKKIISSDITAFEQGTLASLMVEHVGNVTVDF